MTRIKIPVEVWIALALWLASIALDIWLIGGWQP